MVAATDRPPDLRLVAEVPPSGEDHGQVVSVGDLDGHLVADGATRLDDGRNTASRRGWSHPAG